MGDEKGREGFVFLYIILLFSLFLFLYLSLFFSSPNSFFLLFYLYLILQGVVRAGIFFETWITAFYKIFHSDLNEAVALMEVEKQAWMTSFLILGTMVENETWTNGITR